MNVNMDMVDTGMVDMDVVDISKSRTFLVPFGLVFVEKYLSWVLMSLGRQHFDGSKMINLGNILKFSP